MYRNFLKKVIQKIYIHSKKRMCIQKKRELNEEKIFDRTVTFNRLTLL